MIRISGILLGRNPVARRLRVVAQRVLFPLDKLSYAVYSMVHRPRTMVQRAALQASVQRILILSPHQDDELLGCGGFIVRYGHERSIRVAYMTDGRGGAHRTPEAQQALADRRNKEAKEICRTLSVSEPIFLDFRDGTLTNEERMVPALEELIGSIRPDVIMAPFITDAHPDHVATSRALAAVRDTLLEDTELWLYQVHSHIPDRLLNRCLGLTAHEHHAKENALKIYASQGMGRGLTLSKYLLFSKMAPQIGKQRGVVSVEHFAVLNCAEFKELYKVWDPVVFSRLKTINYSPYSFRNFLSNKRTLDAPNAS